MSTYRDNTRNYPTSLFERSRFDEAYLPFTAIVLTVDYERKVLTLLDDNTRMVYQEVRVWPANASSAESTDVSMPEQGTHCIAINTSYVHGMAEVAVIAWVTSNTLGAVDAIAERGLEGVEGWTQRRRGTYRKAFPGQKTTTTTSGFSEKLDDGWDRSGSDFSRDRLDTARRTRTQIASRDTKYSDAGLRFEGPVHRAKASGYQPILLPDGTNQYTLFLNPSAAYKDRYVSGAQDVLPISENVEKIQEFALDYPVPMEVLDTALLDMILGTTQNPYIRTTVLQANVTLPDGSSVQVSYDNESYMINQAWDNPQSRTAKAVGPTTQEGPTPARRGFVIEKAQGTLVGSNLFDTTTYGKALKPVLTPATYDGRFGADFMSGYNPVATDSQDNMETRMAASGLSVRFPYEYNTTRWDVTKEGMLLFEVSSSVPKGNTQFAGSYEYPHGAGRSVEGHLVGSLKLVIGKNHDEEDAIDLQALGQSVLRLGADDCSLPDAGRTVMTQNRAQSDAVQKRTTQYWTSSALGSLGNPGSLTHKTKGENISIRAASDGAVVFRFGARTPETQRCHLMNGYQDPQGRVYQPVGGSRTDSHSPGRPNYGFGDSKYQFHDLSMAGTPQTFFLPYAWSGDTVKDMDRQGLSIDFHTVRDILIRAGKDTDHGQSLLMDLAGGMVMAIGKDTEGRSWTFAMDGGIEGTIQANNQGKAVRLELNGDLDVTVKGNFHMNVTGDTVWESNSHRHITHTDHVVTAQKIVHSALAQITHEAPDIVLNEGDYFSNANA